MQSATKTQSKLLLEMENLFESFNRWMENDSDPRSNKLFLMSSPVPTFAVCASFLVIAKLLQIWMKSRDAWNIRWMIWTFYFFHLVVAVVSGFLLAKLQLFKNFNFRCQPIDISPDTDIVPTLGWFYFIYNFTFFSEIFVFILGKRPDRITKYLVYHHLSLPLCIWWIIKFSPTGHSMFFVLVNSSVHIVTFLYLSIAGAFPRLKKHFWWWKSFYNTMIMLRIITIVLHASQLLVWNDCKYPMIYPSVILINAPIFILFTVSDFLLHDSKRKKRQRIAEHENLCKI